ncbi:MAG: RagB/SusD family nutrient uptake outer membrane protein [Gemmatimonas sp.]|nr:RagB/SusD family nutrient uptake outer membrane protein [Gemmatimonas sp.]
MTYMSTTGRWFAVALLAVGTGCDLEVSNPGPVQDDFLNDSGAHAALVAGIEMSVARGFSMVGFFGADAAKEYTQGGRIHPIKLTPNPGQLDLDEQLPDNAWNDAHEARWVAEDGVRRLMENVSSFDSSPLAARALLYSGYTNRLLGENMCDAVIDGDEMQDRTVHLERAESWFTDAIAVAEAAGEADLVTAAYAGRASVRLWLAKNDEAVADAMQVPVDFEYRLEFGLADDQHYNWIQYVSSNTPYRLHSVWNTYYEDYYLSTGDPRVAWGTDPDVPTAEFAYVPWYFQLKYPELDSPMNLSSGREMVLIRAEAALRSGDRDGAMDLINSLRTGIADDTGTPIPLWTASNATEAWTALKRERGIELWLETRRLGDLWRWVENDVPGEMEDVSDRIRLCFPVGRIELETNPNIPLDYRGPVNPLFTG